MGIIVRLFNINCFNNKQIKKKYKNPTNKSTSYKKSGFCLSCVSLVHTKPPHPIGRNLSCTSYIFVPKTPLCFTLRTVSDFVTTTFVSEYVCLFYSSLFYWLLWFHDRLGLVSNNKIWRNQASQCSEPGAYPGGMHRVHVHPPPPHASWAPM